MTEQACLVSGNKLRTYGRVGPHDGFLIKLFDIGLRDRLQLGVGLCAGRVLDQQNLGFFATTIKGDIISLAAFALPIASAVYDGEAITKARDDFSHCKAAPLFVRDLAGFANIPPEKQPRFRPCEGIGRAG